MINLFIFLFQYNVAYDMAHKMFLEDNKAQLNPAYLSLKSLQTSVIGDAESGLTN